MKKTLCTWILTFAATVLSTQLTLAESGKQTSAPQSVAAKAPEASYNAAADPHAIVTIGHARFTILTPQLIRMEWSADGKFEDRPSFVFLNRRLPVPKFTHSETASGLIIDTSALKLTYNPQTGTDGKFTDDNLTITFDLNGKQVTWHPGTPDTGNLQGTTRTLDGARGSKTREPIEPGLISRDGWTLVDDSTRPLFDSDNFNFTHGEASPWPWVVLRPAGDRQDWYFFGYGHDYKQALHDYVQVAGRIPLPPRFAFGAWWSRYWAYSDQELDDLVRGFHDNNVPLDVLVIDMDWHLNKEQLEARHEVDQSGHELGWSGYTWNPLLFPDPAPFLKNLHEEGLKATLNLHPASGVQPWEAAYPAMARAMGIDPATHKYVPFDITNKKYAQNYMDLLHHPLEKEGIDFWWLDWQQEHNTQMAGVSPTWWLNYVHFTDQEREGKRPLLFHRWGGLGNHRYQIGFSGDTISVWDSLAFQPWFTATAANVGYAYWSHDIGGHMPGAVAPELYTRWIQFGAFSPILRTHTTKNPDSERRIWAYPEPYSGIMRSTFQLRYALEPYLYTEGRRTYDTGVAFLRPLYYDWPEADEAYSSKNEYVFGKDMIVAPVTTPVDKDSQLADEAVWIPQGEWIERPTGKHFTGPQTVQRKYSISQIPVFLRAGAIVPMQPKMLYTGQKPVDPLILNIFPFADTQTSTYSVYDDASRGENYKSGVCAWTDISAKQSGDDLTIEIAPVRGSYPGMLTQRSYEIRLPGDWPPNSVISNGTALTFALQSDKPSWHYEGNTLSTIITTPRYSVSERVVLHIHRPAGSLASRAQLDGFAGAEERLREAYDTLNAQWPFTRAPDPLIDAWQTGDRISYKPETAREQIARFPQVYAEGEKQVQDLADKTNVPDDQLVKQLMQNRGRDTTVERAQQYRASLQRSLTLLNDGKPAEKNN
ncbi:TIM-barrel domain-containing protein [Acidicapsa dinghuensis]|uniref:TIM-barrel domain-containing protein n=1 Tax=Acidicapsa dinghuensis TaxID=2218256 RepID=A0ABW1EJQ7_9BACT|nr:glycoside hydrolase family 31 protein [Acidicapsa dinghuensis]